MSDGFFERVRAVPWSAWAVPAVSWALLLACLYGAVLCMCVLVRRQWVENERLPFPLASIFISLIETPEPGRCFNVLLRNRLFWVTASAVFFVHGMNALAQYHPSYFPAISVRYDLRSLFAEGAWKFADNNFKTASVFFCVVGIVYFLQSSVTFSFFASYLLLQVVLRMAYGSYGQELTNGMTVDFAFGALVPFAAMILWIGRGHWRLIALQMFRGRRDGEAAGAYLSYPVAGWGFVGGLAGMVVWLMAAGVTLAGAIVLVLMLMTLLLVITRIVAETGLVFVQLPIPLTRPWVFLASSMGKDVTVRTTLKSYFITSWFHTLFTHDLRETSAVFTSHALKTTDHAMAQRPTIGRGMAVVACLALAMGVGYLTAGASTLYSEYGHSVTLDAAQDSPLNQYGVNGTATRTLQSGVEYRPPGTGPKEGHSRWAAWGTGFGVTTVLAWMRLRFVGWPLHPMGCLLAYTYPMERIWFSLVIGWAAKLMIVRVGGSEFFYRAKPAFIGLIIGEVAAAAFWLVVSLVLTAFGQPYHAIRLLPS